MVVSDRIISLLGDIYIPHFQSDLRMMKKLIFFALNHQFEILDQTDSFWFLYQFYCLAPVD